MSHRRVADTCFDVCKEEEGGRREEGEGGRGIGGRVSLEKKKCVRFFIFLPTAFDIFK